MSDDHPTDLDPYSSLDQIDIVCDRFENEWLEGKTPDLNDYLQMGNERNPLLRELLGLEIDYREQSGERVTLSELRTRFPDDTLLVAEVLSSRPDHQTRYRFSLPMDLDEFQLKEKIGEGSFGTVYLAHDTKLSRDVAIKVANRGSSGEVFARMVREAKNVAQLKHPGIVPVYSVGDSDVGPYIVMEYVAGSTLREHLSRDHRLDFRQSAKLIVSVAQAVHSAHEAGVVHRDLKPGNIMLSDERSQRSDERSEPVPRVLDFGLARRRVSDMNLTLDGQVLGTPAYMSPEQASGKTDEVDVRSDVYSLGVILYELLVGRRPFSGGLQTLIRKVGQENPHSPRRLDRTIPRDLNAIGMKCLQKEKSDRYASALDLATDLQRWLDQKPIFARQPSIVNRATRWVQRKRGLSMAIAAAVCIALFSLFFSVRQTARSNQETAQNLVKHYLDCKNEKIVELLRSVRDSGLACDVLVEKLKSYSPADVRKTCLSAIALLPTNQDHLLQRKQVLFALDPIECRVIRHELKSVAQELTPFLWRQANVSTQDLALKASIYLAEVDPHNSEWAGHLKKMVPAILIQPPHVLRSIVAGFDSIKLPLLAELKNVFQTTTDADLGKAAASAILMVAKSDFGQIVPLLKFANFQAFKSLVAALQTDSQNAVSLISQELQKIRNQDDVETQHQAVAIVRLLLALMNLEPGSLFAKHAGIESNPNLQTYLIHWPQENGFEPIAMANQFKIESERKLLYTLILCLSKYATTNFDQALGKEVESKLLWLYAEHPDPAVHSAAMYAIRKWELQDDIHEIDKRLMEKKITEDRDWYINSLGQCMALLPLDDSKLDAADQPNEAHHQRRYLAVATTETTVAQFRKFTPTYQANELSPLNDCPVTLVTWFDALQYCSHLSESEALEAAVKMTNESVDGIDGDRWLSCTVDLEKSGYRLPSWFEFEWFYSAGSDADCFFGDEKARFLHHYIGPMLIDRDRTTAIVASSMPNQFGIFDVIANVGEWTLTETLRDRTMARQSLVEHPRIQVKDPRFVLPGVKVMVYAGGSLKSEFHRLSRHQKSVSKAVRSYDHIGFRICRTVFRNR